MESEVLLEVTRLGVPLQAWENYEYLLLMNNHETLADALAGVGAVTTNSYNEKFWTEPGYLGTEDSELEEPEEPETKTGKEPEKEPVKTDISKTSVSKIASQAFTGKAITPEVRLTYNGTVLVKNKDYTIEITMKKGRTYTIGNYKYKVTDARTNGKGTVTVTGVKSKTLKSITVRDTVKSWFRR